jgi:hemerythrin-like domain-containing protein
MSKRKIQESMQVAHREIEKKFDKAVDGFGIDKKSCADLFAQASKSLEDHFLFEERNIFGLDVRNNEAKEAIRKLYKEHNEMRGLVQNIEDDLRQDKHTDFAQLLGILQRHHTLEDKFLYPLLDKLIEEQGIKYEE